MCQICKEDTREPVETVCGHSFCGKKYVGECLLDQIKERNLKCMICECRISLLFTIKKYFVKDVAKFNATSPQRDSCEIIFESWYLISHLIHEKDRK